MKKQFTELIGVFSALVFLIFLTPTEASAQYCDAASGNTVDDWIINVQFAGIDNTSGPATYTDFTDISATVSPGLSYDFTTTLGNSATWEQFVTVYIDWDQDEVFNEDDERYDLGSCAFNGCTVTGPIAVPLTAAPGATRMRVIENWLGFVDETDGLSCYSATFGEVEDYTVNVASGTDCEVPDLVYNIDRDCEAGTYDVTVDLNDYGVDDDGNDVQNLSVFISDDNDDWVPNVGPEIVFPFFAEGSTGQAVVSDVPVGTTITLIPDLGEGSPCNQAVNLVNDPCPPPNADCVDAEALVCGESVFGTTLAAGSTEDGCGFATAGEGVWYSLMIEGDNNAFVRLRTCFEETDFDTDISIYTGSCGELECFDYTDGTPADLGGCTGAFPLNFRAGIEFIAEAGVMYTIQVHGFDSGETGNFRLDTECEIIECDNPELTLTAQDAEGNPIEGCQAVEGEFFVVASLSGGSGNDSYGVVVDGNEPDTIPAEGSTEPIGPFPAGETIDASALGVQDNNCEVSATYESEICPPENDECGEALPLACGDNVTGTTVGAIAWEEANPDQEFCGTFQPATSNGGVWYALEITELSVVDLDLSGSDYDTKIFLYSGSCAELVCIDGDDDGGTGVDSRLEANLDAGTYYVYVSGFSGSSGTYTLNVTCTPIECENPTVTLTTVDAEGNPILEDCLLVDGEFFVELDFAPAEGNDSYTANVDGEEETLTEAVVNTYGPFTPGTDVDVSIVGDTDENCGFNGSATVDVCPPANDLCADRVEIGCSEVVIGATLGATFDDVGTCGTSNTAPGVWYSLTVENDAEIDLELCDSQYDTKISVFSGTCEELVCVGGNDDPPFGVEDCASSGLHSKFSFSATGGTEYLILVHGFGSATGIFQLAVNCTDLECSPTATATAVADNVGTPLDGCLEQDGSYWVEVTLAGGGDQDYNVSVNGGDPVVVGFEGTGYVGPINALTDAEISVVAVDNPACSAQASASVDNICPPGNDQPCDAAALVVDGEIVQGPFSNENATSDDGEIAPPDGGCAGTQDDPTWCDGFGGGGDFGTLNNTIWFSVVVPPSGAMEIDLCNEGATFDNQLAVYRATDCQDYSTFELVAANDDRPFDTFGGCDFGLFRSGVRVCAEPGETLLLQVDGYNGAIGNTVLRISELEDNGFCFCDGPVFPPEGFTLAQSFPICGDPENIGYGVTWFAPEDIGSSEFFVYEFTWNANEGDPIIVEVPAGGEVTTDDPIIPLGDFVTYTLTVSDPNCSDINPIQSGTFGQNDEGCDPDCEGTLGGPAQPGTACETEGGEPGTWDDDCVCQPAPENDNCADATEVVVDGAAATGNNEFASASDLPAGPCWFAGDPVDNDVFHWFVAPNAAVTIETFAVDGSGFTDTQLQVFESCDAEASIACDDDGGAGLFSLIDFECGELTPGETYWIQLDGFAGDFGDYSLSVTSGEPCLEGGVVEGSVTWNSNCGERDASMAIYEAGTSNLLNTYDAVVDANGEFSVEISETGSADLYLKVDGYLQKVASGVELVDDVNDVDFGAIIFGDITGNNSIGIADFGIFANSYDSDDGDPNYNPFSDFNCDGSIGIQDYGPFANNYDTDGDAPAQ